MSFPPSSPSLGAYLAWAASVGCECKFGYGGPHVLPFVKITAPSGKSVVHIGTDQGERLLSKTLNHLDRRLGLESPFPRISSS